MKLFFEILIIAFILVIRLVAGAQHSEYMFSDSAIESRLKIDIGILASDSFEGREAGTDGELKARDYIRDRFIEIGLEPLFGDTSYFQKFEFGKWKYFGSENELKINEKKYSLYSDYYPLSYSANIETRGEIVNVGYGITAPDLNYDDYKNLGNFEGKIFIMEISIPGGYDKNSKFYKYGSFSKRIDTAIQRGAKAIIFVNSETEVFNPTTKIRYNIKPKSIPIIFFTRSPEEIALETQNKEVYIKVDIRNADRTAYNVAGYINNKADQSVILGGHYDHLGFKEKGASKRIYNGADDNASGTAAVIEIARYINKSNLKDKNYIFIAFSAEEKGLIGARHFASCGVLDTMNACYMLNFDMVGRLDEEMKLYLIGYATSTIWDSLIGRKSFEEGKVKRIKASIEFSDQHPFYKLKMPVLFLHSGEHEDYHKISDEADKINYLGEVEIIKFAENLISKLDTCQNIQFNEVSGFEVFVSYIKVLVMMLDK